ncbi:MAG: HEAT repeat domain-containing protein, partial [Cyanobacteria bacterium P01_H01_bin.15]
MSNSTSDVEALVNSADFGERIRGINQLRNIDPAVAYELIKPLVTDDNARIRYAAISQLDPLGQQNPEEALAILRDRLMNDSEVDVKGAAADALGGLGLTAGFEDLVAAYQGTSEWLLQMSIVAALGSLGDLRAVDLLLVALQSDVDLVKTTAISALGDLGDLRALDPLLEFVTDSDWQIRYRLAQALQKLNADSAL